MAEVSIILSGQTVQLVPSLRAARAVDNLGGVQEAVRLIGNLHLNSYAVIVGAAMGKQPSEVEEAVYLTGMTKLAEPLSRFLSLVANGGKEPGDRNQGDGSGEA